MTNYILGNSSKEAQRLTLQSRLFEKETRHTMSLAGIRKGMRCLDVGCGLGDTSFLMSKLVGENGKVVGVDINEDNIMACKKKLCGFDNIRFIAVDILQHLERFNDLSSSPFDFVYSRFLFQHLSDPKRALKQLSELTADKGVIVIEELDHGLWLSHPFDPNLRRLRKAYISLLRIAGCDPFVARKLYGLFLKNGLKPNVAAYSVCVPMGVEKRNSGDGNGNICFSNIGVLMAEVLKENLLDNGLMNRSEFDLMVKGLKKYSRNPTGLVLYALAFRIWAKRP